MDRPLDNLDAAERRAGIVAQEFVVIAGDVDQAAAASREPDQLRTTALCASGQYQLERRHQPSTMSPTRNRVFGVVVTKEIDQALGLAPPAPEMNVGDEQAPDPGRTAAPRRCRSDRPEARISRSSTAAVAPKRRRRRLGQSSENPPRHRGWRGA